MLCVSEMPKMISQSLAKRGGIKRENRNEENVAYDEVRCKKMKWKCEETERGEKDERVGEKIK